MIQLRRITSAEDCSFAPLMELYTEAFPPEERRNPDQLAHLLLNQDCMHFNAVELDGELAGLFVYWEFPDFYYLEHLAVFSAMRNHKIGQQVLDFARDNLKGIRLLEVEPAEEEMAIRRINYYVRNGYMVLDREYVQPSYDGVRASIPLWIMGNVKYDRAEELARHIATIKEEVYHKPRK